MTISHKLHSLLLGITLMAVSLGAVAQEDSTAIKRDRVCHFLRMAKSFDFLKMYFASGDEAMKDSCRFMLHDMYAYSPNLNDLQIFYGVFDGKCLRALKKKDKKAMKIYNKYRQLPYTNAEKLIIAAAPYYVAYQALQLELSFHIKYKNWDGAKADLKRYKPYFGDDPAFLELERVINAEEDPSIVIEKLANVNHEKGEEYVPVLCADGSQLFFCGRYRQDSIGKEDVYVSQHTDSGWGPASPVRELSSPDHNESPVSISTDGTTMILFVSGKLYTTTKGADGWQKPVPLPNSINISTWQSDAMITSDGKAMLFAAQKQVSNEIKPSINIFVSLLDENGEWGTPIELGPTINTPYMDRSPVLHSDMKTLYFCSEGHGSLGGLDVFMSKRLSEDSWTLWSEPVNLGKEINTHQNDCWYQITTNGKEAYFSQKDEKGSYDLYRTALPASLRPTPVATIVGKVTDMKGNHVTTIIKWEDLETHAQVGQSNTDPVDGSFFIVLPEGKNYGYYIDDENYFPVSSNIDLREKDEPIEIENNIVVASIEQMVKQQTPMPLNNLFFNTAEAVLLPASINELQRIVKILNKHPYRVEIGGHTDNVGADGFNKRLSEQRAKAVKDYLMQNGIDAKRLIIRGYGKSKPIASNKTEEGRQKNRRVEFKFIK